MDVFSFVKSKGNLVSVLMSAGTVLAGTAGAVVRGNMEILAASICLLFAVFTQLGANYRHAYELEKLHISSLPRKKIHNLKEDEPNPLEKRVKQRMLHSGRYAGRDYHVDVEGAVHYVRHRGIDSINHLFP